MYQPCFRRWYRGGHRQEYLAPFKRKHVTYTFRFEEYVLRMPAKTVERIVKDPLQDDKQIAPRRIIEHIGFDEIGLKKRHKLYVTIS